MFNKTKKKMLEWMDFKTPESSENDVVLRAPRTPSLTEEEHTIISYIEEHLFTLSEKEGSDGVCIDTTKWTTSEGEWKHFDTGIVYSMMAARSVDIPHLSVTLQVPSLVAKNEGWVSRYTTGVHSCSLISREKLQCLADAINKSKNEKLAKHSEYVRVQRQQRVKEAVEAITKEKE